MKTLNSKSYACLNCRKAFKKSQNSNCPDCGLEMYEAGAAFKPPKKNNLKEWAKLKPLFESGYTFKWNAGDPFNKVEKTTITKKDKMPESEFRKQARKRNK